MSDNLMSYFDTDRNAVIICLESGSEVAVLAAAEAESLGNEILAASRGESTGYEEFFAQQNDDGYGSDDPDEQALADADDALRVLAGDQPASTKDEQGACVLTGVPGEDEDDCTTHDHEDA